VRVRPAATGGRARSGTGTAVGATG
jgi:hypothetical protein